MVQDHSINIPPNHTVSSESSSYTWQIQNERIHETQKQKYIPCHRMFHPQCKSWLCNEGHERTFVVSRVDYDLHLGWSRFIRRNLPADKGKDRNRILLAFEEAPNHPLNEGEGESSRFSHTTVTGLAFEQL